MANDPDLIAFGQRIQTLRKSGGLTQEELAASCDLSPTYIGYIENGHRNPSLKVIYSLARGLGVPPSALIGTGGEG